MTVSAVSGKALGRGAMRLETGRLSRMIAGVSHDTALGRAGVRPVRTPISAHLLVAAIGVADILILVVSGILASHASFSGDGAMGQSIAATLLAAGVTVFALHHMAVYAPGRLGQFGHRLRATLIAMALGGVVQIACFALLAVPAPELRLWLAFWLVIAGGLATLAAGLGVYSTRRLARAERLAPRVAVVGVNDYSNGFIARLTRDTSQAATFVGLYDDGHDDGHDDGQGAGAEPLDGLGAALGTDLPVLGQLADLTERTRRERIDAIVLALPLFDMDRIVRARAALGSVTADIYMAGEILDLTCKAGQVERLGPNAVIKIGSRPLSEWQTLQKGATDFLLSAILLVGALPLLALVALAIRLDSPGPVLFRQPRLGFNNNMFNVFKFRTMYHHMRDLNADRQTTRGDPRVTRVGRILRMTSMDEMPQLLNVLRGEMSLVGPRPHAPNTKAGDQLFHDVVADYALRHRVKPGITGWAQVNGWRGETRTREQIEQRVAHDLHYIDNWSLLLDLKIIALTALRELNSKAAF